MLRSMIGAAILLALSSQAHALSCKQVRAYVASYGEPAVISWALTHGYTEAQVIYLKRVCRI